MSSNSFHRSGLYCLNLFFILTKVVFYFSNLTSTDLLFTEMHCYLLHQENLHPLLFKPVPI